MIRDVFTGHCFSSLVFALKSSKHILQTNQISFLESVRTFLSLCEYPWIDKCWNVANYMRLFFFLPFKPVHRCGVRLRCVKYVKMLGSTLTNKLLNGEWLAFFTSFRLKCTNLVTMSQLLYLKPVKMCPVTDGDICDKCRVCLLIDDRCSTRFISFRLRKFSWVGLDWAHRTFATETK